MKTSLKYLSLFFITAAACFSTVGCNNSGGGSISESITSGSTLTSHEERTSYSYSHDPHVPYNYENYYGICCLTGEAGGGIDKGLTNKWSARNIKAMNFKSQRVWLSPVSLFNVDDNDNITVSVSYYKVLKDHVEKNKAAGINQFLVVYQSYVYPTIMSPSDYYVAPDPNVDPELYIRWIKLQAKASAKMAELFPEFNIFEPGNEVDFNIAPCIHKDGFDGTYEYCFDVETKAAIVCDLCYYIRQAIKAVNPNLTVSLPGLTNQAENLQYLDAVYMNIKSHKLPIDTQFSDLEPNHYFDYLNFHPYPLNDVTTETGLGKWKESISELYAIAQNYGDDGKPVLISELGWSTGSPSGLHSDTEDASNAKIVKVQEICYKTLKADFPQVVSIFAFRMTNLYYQEAGGQGEETFGLFYHPNDTTAYAGGGTYAGRPRPQAYSLSKIINGASYDLDAHLDPLPL